MQTQSTTHNHITPRLITCLDPTKCKANLLKILSHELNQNPYKTPWKNLKNHTKFETKRPISKMGLHVNKTSSLGPEETP